MSASEQTPYKWKKISFWKVFDIIMTLVNFVFKFNTNWFLITYFYEAITWLMEKKWLSIYIDVKYRKMIIICHPNLQLTKKIETTENTDFTGFHCENLPSMIFAAIG